MTGHLFNQGRQLEKGNASDIQISPSLKTQARSKAIRQDLAWHSLLGWTDGSVRASVVEEVTKQTDSYPSGQ